MDLEELQSQITYKYGRNVLLFQELERMLKYLVANGQISGSASTVRAKFDKHRESVLKRTLGMVMGDHLDAQEPPPVPDDLEEAHFSFSFRIEYTGEKKEQLEQLVEERNHLIHHFLSDILENSDGDLVTSWALAGDNLDTQYDRLKIATEDIRCVVQEFREARQAALDYMQSKEFKNQLNR
tara:strand:+ start:1791 stop:2336 length:546 start_codon:yes stop_codon:yes gene_type:complete